LKLYLVRHGLAGQSGDYPNDRQRPLTDEGQKKMAKVARRLAELGVTFDRVLSSPLVRARQTAEILLAHKLGDAIEEFCPLAPGGEIQDWIDWWRQSSNHGTEHSLALVGHEPDLGHWAELLVWGEARGKLPVKKAGVIGLEIPDTDHPLGQGELFLLTSPKWLLLS
jgi:phosphohistidine phosphatase